MRSQLQRYSDALENDLITGRDRIAAKVKEALGYEQRFGEASETLVRHLRDKPECRDLIDDLVSRDGNRQQHAGGGGSAAAEPPVARISNPTDPSPGRRPTAGQ